MVVVSDLALDGNVLKEWIDRLELQREWMKIGVGGRW
jgi:hypothetical protein